MAQFCARVRKRADLPSVSMKDVYQHPTITGLATALAPAPPRRAPPRPVAGRAAPVPRRSWPRCWPDVLDVESVSVDGHFFDDLGADSMVMAQFCARVRKRHGPAVGVDEGHLPAPDDQRPGGGVRAGASGARTDVAPTPVESPRADRPSGSPGPGADGGGAGRHAAVRPLRGAAAADLPRRTPRSPRWSPCAASSGSPRGSRVSGPLPAVGDVRRRDASSGCVPLPILAKWVLVGRWKPRQIRVWSLAYVRFWVVKTLVRSNPLVLFVGSPLYSLYLRALGAKIGRGVVIFSRTVPVCTDLLTIGAGTVIRKESFISWLPGARRRDPDRPGHPRPGRLRRREDRARHRHVDGRRGAAGPHVVAAQRAGGAGGRALARVACRAHRGRLPDGRAALACSVLRRVVFPLVQLLNLLVVYLPLAFAALRVLFAAGPAAGPLVDSGPTGVPAWDVLPRRACSRRPCCSSASSWSASSFVVTVPRLLNLAVTPGRVYRLYGFHYWVHRLIARHDQHASSSPQLFGDSSYIVGYLRCLGLQAHPGRADRVELRHRRCSTTTRS